MYRSHFNYEEVRIGRYCREANRQYYSDTEIMQAYQDWAYALGKREEEWDIYCDVRDCFPKGTNARIAKERSILN